jgi:hypothetical protein
MGQKRRLCDNCGQQIKDDKKGSYCSKECFESDTEHLEDDGFECCSDCDLPDACADFGCAIEKGIRIPSLF